MTDLEAIIPRSPQDILKIRQIIHRVASSCLIKNVSGLLRECEAELSFIASPKFKFLSEMYARACYCMVFVSARGLPPARLFLRGAGRLELPRPIVIYLMGKALPIFEKFGPRRLLHDIAVIVALIAFTDHLLDQKVDGQSENILDELERSKPYRLLRSELSHSANDWQREFWKRALLPAILAYCRAEIQAKAGESDPVRMGYRHEGIIASISGMWYAIGPYLGLKEMEEALDQKRWTPQQWWMYDTSLLMQMIDDWLDSKIDQQEGRHTAVLSGDWTIEIIQRQFEKTLTNQSDFLKQNGIKGKTMTTLFTDLYKDYVRSGLEAMQTGVAV